MLSTNDVFEEKQCLSWRIASKASKELPSLVCQIYQQHFFRVAEFIREILHWQNEISNAMKSSAFTETKTLPDLDTLRTSSAAK